MVVWKVYIVQDVYVPFLPLFLLPRLISWRFFSRVRTRAWRLTPSWTCWRSMRGWACRASTWTCPRETTLTGTTSPTRRRASQRPSAGICFWCVHIKWSLIYSMCSTMWLNLLSFVRDCLTRFINLKHRIFAVKIHHKHIQYLKNQKVKDFKKFVSCY